MDSPVDITVDARGVATLTLNRPDVHNSFDAAMIESLIATLVGIKKNDAISALVLQGRGKSFSAGADLNWMRRSTTFTLDQNLADAEALARLMDLLYRIEIPTLALVRGAAFGGGVGLVACCDIAIGARDARFSLSEVRLGLIPAVISPYVISAIGPRQAKRYFQTGEVFTAETARQIGLLHEVVEDDALEATRNTLLDHLQRGGPAAKAAAKALISEVACRPIDPHLVHRTAQLIAQQRATDEAREGLTAFLEKRTPAWRRD